MCHKMAIGRRFDLATTVSPLRLQSLQKLRHYSNSHTIASIRARSSVVSARLKRNCPREKAGVCAGFGPEPVGHPPDLPTISRLWQDPEPAFFVALQEDV